MLGLLGGLDSNNLLLLGGKGPSHGAGLLDADVLGGVLLSLAEFADSLFGLGVVNGEDAGN